MNIRQYLLVFVSLSMIFCFPAFGYCYWENVHQRITFNAIDKSALTDSLIKSGFLNGVSEKIKDNKNIEKKIREWIEDGSESEDEFFSSLVTARYLNHFYDPLSGLGLVDPPFLGTSSYIWASNDGYNAWRWEMARTYFYDGLTKTTKTGRDEALSKSFRAIGQVMHLVQDLAVPAHVRNDAHPTGDPYELWTRSNVANLDYSMVTFQYWNVSISPSAPKQFWDLDSYDGSTVYESGYIGLSEYTNANFFSKDTIFKKYPHPIYDDTNSKNIDWMHPEKIDAEDGKLDSRIYIKKLAGDTDYSLAAFSYFSYDCIKKGYYQFQPMVLDDKVHKEYASRLLPRTVGYSAGLLNYFFRGTLELSAPDRCVYSLIDGAGTQEFTKIKAKVRNTTTNESISGGTLTAVARYKVRTDYLPDMSNDPPTPPPVDPGFSYSVSGPITLNSDDMDALNGANNIATKEFTFNFTSSPIPAGITDLYLQVVFKGTLGNESDNAIAVGFKDLSEPTHINVWNTTDYVYRAGQLRVADDLEKVTLNERIAFCPTSGWPPQDANDYQVQYMPMEPGQFGRIIFISDPGIQIFYGVTDTPVNDPNPTVANDWYLPWTTVYQDGTVGANTHVYEFRGKAFHEASGYYYASVPDAGFWLADWPAAQGDAIPAANLNW